MLVRGSAAEFEMDTSSQKGTFWMASKYWPVAQVGAGGAALAGADHSTINPLPTAPIVTSVAVSVRSARARTLQDDMRLVAPRSPMSPRSIHGHTEGDRV